MAKIYKLANGDSELFSFWCEGCQTHHGFNSGWTFNGDFDKPTVSPSILVRSGHYMPEHKGSCWCDYNKEHPDEPLPFRCGVCHSFVRDGKIEYLSDCTHKFAGQTLELEDVEESILTNEETPCPVREDGIHCNCWYDGEPCCSCGQN